MALISMIFAVAQNGCIGKDNELPWPRIPADMMWFKQHTSGKVVVMGSNTWFSLPKRPLPNRVNIVVSNKEASWFEESQSISSGNITLPSSVIQPDMVVNGTPEEIVAKIKAEFPKADEIAIMGGAQVYNSFKRLAERLYVSLVGESYEGDTFLDTTFLADYEEVFKYESVGDHVPVTYKIMDKKQ